MYVSSDIVVCGGPIVSNKAHCVSGAETDLSNPNLQVAWQRLQLPLPPLITTCNQLACLDMRSARHKTSLGSSGDTVLLGKQPQGFTERPGRPCFSISIPPPPLVLKEGGWRIHTRSSRRFSGLLLDVYPSISFQDGDALLAVMTKSSP